MEHFNYGIEDFIPCEICFLQQMEVRANDVHRIDGRGEGKNVIGNLMALCRDHHNKCHNATGDEKISKELAQELHDFFMSKYGSIHLR